MAEKKPKLPIYTTPVGVASFPWLNKPDTKFNADGEYRVTLIFTEAEAQKLTEKLNELNLAAVKQMQKENPKAKVKARDGIVKPALDRDKNEIEGKVAVSFKMKAKIKSKASGQEWEQRPGIFDAKGTPIPNAKIGGGTRMKVAFEAAPYLNQKDKEAGVTLRLKGVQVIELVEWSQERDAKSLGFGEEEGYEVGSDEAPTTAEGGESAPDAETDF